MQATLEEPPTRTAAAMPDSAGSKPVRLNADVVNKLATVESMKTQMGERFRVNEYVNGLVEKPADELYEETLKRFIAFNSKRKRDAK